MKRNVIYYNVCKGGVAMTLTAAHHSFAFFARRGGSSMTTVIEIYEHDKDNRVLHPSNVEETNERCGI